MRISTMCVAAAAATMVLSNHALADDMTGNELYEHCTVVADRPTCSGTVMGVAMALMVQHKICVPSEVNVFSDEFIDNVVVKWLRDHPGELDREASGLLIEWFLEAYPCG